VADAIDLLNRSVIQCPSNEDLCVVYAATERSYYMVYRRGRFESALAQLGVTREELARGGSTVIPVGSATSISEGRPSLCEVSEPTVVVGRPSLADAVGGTPKVIRQASMPARAVARERLSVARGTTNAPVAYDRGLVGEARRKLASIC
jgi:hypothetical protein